MANLRVNKITGTEVFETTGSVQFDGTGDFLSLADSADFDFGSGDFTVEGWIYLIGNGEAYIVGQSNSVGANSSCAAAIVVSSTNILIGRFFNGSDFYETTHSVLQKNVWNHFALVRNGSSGVIYLNGIAGTPINLGSIALNNSSNQMSIGRVGEYDSRYFNGHISNLRIIKGTALYTKNFTPPTRELTVIPNTVLLCCQSTTRANEERTGKTITVNGNAVANELTPGLLTDRVKSGGDSAISGSVEFDESGDFLQIVRGSNTDFEFGTQDFTIEFFAHFAKTDMRIMSTGDNGNYTTGGWVFETNNQFGAGTSSGTFTYFGTFTYPINSWAHISVVRNGSNIYGFVNGVQQWSNTISTNITFSGTNDFSLGTGRSGSSGVGDYNLTASTMTKGFISNLRIIKGTALYTSNFIPPTRELKRLPGTVLLCCKNSSDPTAEETGKTITPYGSLVYNPPELVIDGAFNSASSWPSAQADWSISGGKATINSANSGYDYLGILTNRTINGQLYELRFDISSWTAGRLELAQSDSSNVGVTVSGNGSYTFRFKYTGTTNGNISLYSYTDTTASFVLDNLSLKQVASVPSPPFTPSVGSDGSVTFDGVTKINSPNYFYLPTGNTEDRGRGRGLIGGGIEGVNASNTIQYITIQSSGNAIDFGDLTQARHGISACSSATRGVFGGGIGPTVSNVIDYVSIQTQGNAQDFGDLLIALRQKAALSNNSRGIFSGGYSIPGPIVTNSIEFITIASIGNAIDFGDLITITTNMAGCSSPTRGLFGGGSTPTTTNTIQYITIASLGNAQDFGDLTNIRGFLSACSSPIRGIFGGGSGTNIIEYVTISSTGNASDFGDLSAVKSELCACSNSVRGVFGGGYTPARLNVLEFITITSTGNAQDFGDLLVGNSQLAACSDSHGGLG